MQWIADLLKDIPTLAVAHERLALAEERGRALEAENGRLREELVAWKKKAQGLEHKLTAVEAIEEFRTHRGLLWRLESEGVYEPCPYCPKCRIPMTPFPPVHPADVWVCSSCDRDAEYCKPPAA